MGEKPQKAVFKDRTSKFRVKNGKEQIFKINLINFVKKLMEKAWRQISKSIFKKLTLRNFPTSINCGKIR